MSGDYKWDIQMIFEELCQERFGRNYWELSEEAQSETYAEATRQYLGREEAK